MRTKAPSQPKSPTQLYLGAVPQGFQAEFQPLAAAPSKLKARQRAAEVLNQEYMKRNGRPPRGLNRILASEIALWRVDLATGKVDLVA